jgi:uncharacterized membrane protein YfcA
MFDGVLVLLGLFALSFGIGVVAPLAGVGGGVLFTPVMLGFTNLHPDLVRATGLAIACYSSIMAGVTFFKQRIAPFRFILLVSTVLLPSAIVGAQAGIYVTALGKWGQGLVRASLGALMFIVLALLLVKRLDWPEPRCSGRVVEVLGLRYIYFEKTLGREVEYCPSRLGIGLPLLALVGFGSGFFGLGAAWALIPIYNLVMRLPLKVTAASASASLAIADTGALWVYTHSEKMYPELVITAALAVLLGAQIGAKLLLKARVRFVRWLILAIMAFNGVQLLTRGLAEMGITLVRII